MVIIVSETKRKKRLDLQGLRGIAIFIVLLFHFFPSYFPNGYLGVDQFFVLSGFLIANMLHKETGSISAYPFYYRRFKRIVPMYALFVLVVLISLFIWYPNSYISINVDSAINALLFITNIATVQNAKQYTVMLSLADDLFTHTWSLGVEIQFYLIVPFLLTIRNRYFNFRRNSFIFFIGLLSFAFHTLTSPTTSFNSVFSRIWQFVIGILTFEITNPTKIMDLDVDSSELEVLEKGETEQRSRLSKGSLEYELLLIFASSAMWIMILGSMYHIAINPLYGRTTFTVLTGVLIASGALLDVPLLSNKWLVYLGDISYTLYLVHWPVYVYLKSQQYVSIQENAGGIVFSMILSIALTETYEKWYLKAEKNNIFIVSGLLYAVCFVIILQSRRLEAIVTHQHDSEQMEKMLLANALSQSINGNNSQATDYLRNGMNKSFDPMILNEYYKVNDIRNLKIDECNPYPTNTETCNFQNVGNDVMNQSILILGNSYADNIGRLVYQHCKTRTNDMKMFSSPACEPLIHTVWQTYKCDYATHKYDSLVIQSKPDYLFLLARYLTFMSPLKSDKMEEDPVYKEAHDTLQRWSPAVKKSIYLLHGLPRPNITITTVVKNWYQNRKPGEKFTNWTSLIEPVDYTPARRRIETLAKNCRNCHLIDFMPEFTIDNQFRIMDDETNVIYFTDGQHLSAYGLQKVSHIFRDICNKI